MNSPKPIECSIAILKANLSSVGQVRDWAEIMEYPSPKLFSRHFLHCFRLRPSIQLKKIRLNSIVYHLKYSTMTHDEIAWGHCLADSKALNKFLNYHTGFPPSQIKRLPLHALKMLKSRSTEKLGRKIRY